LKNAVAIALLFCFVLFHFGYYAVYLSANVSLERNWKVQIYGEQQVQLEERMLEIPLNAPYMANQEEFQATNTRFELEGSYFRAIKQRYQNDTLQVVYVPDTARQVLDTTVKKWIAALAEDQLPQDQETGNLGMQFAKDYLGTGLLAFEAFGIQKFKSEIGFIFSTYLSPSFTLEGPPPQRS
jgi:hypothetical protein